MTNRIRILEENLCNKIAAGEVVERPASVVKELLENALDAGSTELSIEVEQGGKGLVRVSDDGEGMDRDDLLLCVERHATSKIASDDDLFRLRTFGFRGEALPSIAAVSRLTLSSRTASAEAGWEVYLEGGVVRRSNAVGLPCGTVVEVRNLFFNTPARRKFLRRDETELGHIGDVVTKLALANPEVRFRLQHNGRTLIDVYRNHSLEERVAALLGRPLLKDLLPLCQDGEGPLALHGLIAQPGQNRSTSNTIFTYINGRYIRDRVVQHAVMEGYRNLLLKGRYPVVVLFLDLDPELVDVNVHPTKHEVRFRDQRQVHEFIVASLRATLRPTGWLGAPSETVAAPAGITDPPSAAAAAVGRIEEALQAYATRSGTSDLFPQRPQAPPAPQSWPLPMAADNEPPARLPPSPEGYFASLAIIGQYRRSYLLCQDGDDMVLIDQHAAHERIGFERLKAQFLAAGIERQLLLFPSLLELDFREAAWLGEHLDDLARLGFEIEPFGGNAFVVKATPQLLGEVTVNDLIRDVAGELAALGNSGLLEDALDKVLIRMACHGMLRANQTLSPAEGRALLEDLDRVDFRGNCPHGRPVMKRLTLAEVERMFKRS
ncbi:DNA mismatch repair endonuclease MutL [Desulfuromonas carbonis]|uniref:DNA mismatch repair endonuclease MutL n=1 Tax=Desulfuromonas sp. DDH964 TaxID=1823759 RepID=UPI00078C218E|nr:DNA mismatch repair endonuclease MutL [Desulfuromonas sp. DDH964]AMV72619.1 DNA mismatch repair protein [Desulfuromonas sp. DDH964]